MVSTPPSHNDRRGGQGEQLLGVSSSILQLARGANRSTDAKAGNATLTYSDAFHERFYAPGMRLSEHVAVCLISAVIVFEFSHNAFSGVDFSKTFTSLEEGRQECSHESKGPLRGALGLWTYYAVSNVRMFLACLFLVVILLGLTQYANMLIVQWTSVFWAKMQVWGGDTAGSTAELQVYLIEFLFYAFIYIFASTYQRYVMSMLEIEVRASLTYRYSEAWLKHFAFYRLELYRSGSSGCDADNPDQRIQEDIDGFVSGSLSLVVDGVSSFSQFVIFAGTVYAYSPKYVLGWVGVQCPGWLLWASILYSVVATACTHCVSRRLEILNYVRQRTEADFRWELTTVRRYAGEIALSRSATAHEARMSGRFDMIKRCFWETMIVQKRYTVVMLFFSQVEVIFGLAFLGPSFLTGQITLGTLMAATRAMSLVSGSLMWFATSYATIVNWRASTDRLVRFDDAIARRTEDCGGVVVKDACDVDGVKCEGLRVWAPAPNFPEQGGNAVGDAVGLVLFDSVNFDILGGQRVLLAGPSGAGKSCLLRAIAGVWPFAEGEVWLPEGRCKSMFFPADVYVPEGTLRDAVAYPLKSELLPEPNSDAAIEAALWDVGLGHLLEEQDGLESARDWGLSLSSGQKARLSFARMVLHKPKLAAFDEPLAHLEESNHAVLLAMAFEALPKDSCVLVISHQLSRDVAKLFCLRFDVDLQGRCLRRSESGAPGGQQGA